MSIDKGKCHIDRADQFFVVPRALRVLQQRRHNNNNNNNIRIIIIIYTKAISCNSEIVLAFFTGLRHDIYFKYFRIL